MAYFLRALIFLMFLGIGLTVLVAMEGVPFPGGHIPLAIITFLFTIFVQAFVMFYFIGINRLMKNIHQTLREEKDLKKLFERPPEDLRPYMKKTAKFVQDSNICKRQTIPWTMLMLLLGTIAFLLGGACDTGLVAPSTHLGVVYGFIAAMVIGFFRQWHYLKVGHQLLRKVKKLYQIPDGQM